MYLDWELLAFRCRETSNAWPKVLGLFSRQSWRNHKYNQVSLTSISPWCSSFLNNALPFTACPYQVRCGAVSYLSILMFLSLLRCFISFQTLYAASLGSSLVSKVVLVYFWKVQSVIPSDFIMFLRISRLCSVWSHSLANACQYAKRNSNSVNRLLVELSLRRSSKAEIAH